MMMMKGSLIRLTEQITDWLVYTDGECRLLGHLYAAESLVLMNRLNEAIAHLHPDNVAQLSNLPAPESDQKTVAGFGNQLIIRFWL